MKVLRFGLALQRGSKEFVEIASEDCCWNVVGSNGNHTMVNRVTLKRTNSGIL